MKRARKGFALAAVCLIVPWAFAEKPHIATEDELAAITARGRMLYEYDQAAWHASDAVQAMNPPREKLGRYIAQKTDVGWVVAFGHLNDAKDAFLVSVLATPGATLQSFSVTVLDTPKADTGFFLAAARALDSALAAFHTGVNRPYNAAVLPASAGNLYVYLVPAQTDADGDYYPLGADVRFLVSGDGTTLVETRQLHKSIIPKAEIPPGVKVESGYHTHVLSDIPEDTDVFCVLSRRPLMPEYVGTRVAIYVVNTDGTILFIKRMKKQ